MRISYMMPLCFELWDMLAIQYWSEIINEPKHCMRYFINFLVETCLQSKFTCWYQLFDTPSTCTSKTDPTHHMLSNMTSDSPSNTQCISSYNRGHCIYQLGVPNNLQKGSSFLLSVSSSGLYHILRSHLYLIYSISLAEDSVWPRLRFWFRIWRLLFG